MRTKRRPYRAIKVNAASAAQIRELCVSKRIVVAVDVAKERMFAAIMDDEERVLVTVKWSHPTESGEFYRLVDDLGGDHRVDVVMEPTGTYDDALRAQLMRQGIAVFQVSPKLVHDAREFYDGVASTHDAKAAAIIGMLHLSGRSHRLVPLTHERRDLMALTSTLYRYEKQYERERNQLEAMLARFWPGLTDILSLGTKSALVFLAEFGCPAVVAANPVKATECLLRASRKSLGAVKIQAVINLATAEYGERPTQAEAQALRDLASDAERSRDRVRVASRNLETMSQTNEAVRPLIPILGKTSSAVLIAEVGGLRDHQSPASLLRFLGLNLKEVSSGRMQGRLRIAKRGSSRARHYLFYAALRLVYRNPVIRAWYAQKRRRDGNKGLVGVVAVMRKLVGALWHVARGAKFDATRLYDVSRLTLSRDFVEGFVSALDGRPARLLSDHESNEREVIQL